jgi:hypothetical protein
MSGRKSYCPAAETVSGLASSASSRTKSVPERLAQVISKPLLVVRQVLRYLGSPHTDVATRSNVVLPMEESPYRWQPKPTRLSGSRRGPTNGTAKPLKNDEYRGNKSSFTTSITKHWKYEVRQRRGDGTSLVRHWYVIGTATPYRLNTSLYTL